MTYNGYRIEALGTFAAYKIMPPSSGSIPAELSGVFTTVYEAEKAINRSLNSLKKGKRNVEKEGRATD